MTVIGLTGNIGSGKSTVSKRLQQLGAEIVNADEVARKLVAPGSPTLAKIVAAFGPAVLKQDGSLDRKKLGAVVFSNPDNVARLNRITHPAIVNYIKEKIKTFRNRAEYTSCPPGQKNKVLVVEAPLLIETGLHTMVDLIWVVKIDRQTQTRRIMERDNLSPQEVYNRIKSQLPQEEKIRHADLVIDNSGSLEKTLAQVDQAWYQLTGVGEK